MQTQIPLEESERIWKRLAATWDIRPGFYYPLEDDSARQDLLALETSMFFAADGGTDVRLILTTHGVRECWEFPEFRDRPTLRVALSNWSVV